jgi:alpha-D-xyloside xylohydrolase
MKRRTFTGLPVTLPAAALAQSGAPPAARPAPVHPGIWRIRLGTPERYTPLNSPRSAALEDRLKAMPAQSICPVDPQRLSTGATARGFQVSLPLDPNELIYGLGLQLRSFIHRGFKRTLRVNADPITDAGDSHAPVPFYVTTQGYGVYIDTARYAVLYCGKVRSDRPGGAAPAPEEAASQAIQSVLPNAYTRRRIGDPAEMLIEIPSAAGVDLYIFAGPQMVDAVRRYVLFSGGGPIPPRWGLGVWYRTYGQFGQDEVTALARDLRSRNLPCDVIGLEPGWQTHAYSCSFVWS